jgi:hypothetical protein
MLLIFTCGVASAEDWEKYDKPVPTKVVVRVLAHGAKAMADTTGALVVIRDARGGRELDKGTVQGESGDDIAIMRAGYPRLLGAMGLVKGDKGMLFKDAKAEEKAKEKKWRSPDPYYDLRDTRKPEELTPFIYENPTETAKFEAVLNISKPTQVLIEAYGPLIPQQATATAMVSAWIFPGEDITGEGIVLELKGIVVDSLASLKDKEIKIAEVSDGIEVPFYMDMLNGSPISPNGKMGIPWETAGFKVTVQAYYKGKIYYEDVETSDKFYVTPSQFQANVPLPKDLPSGDFKKERVKIRLMAFQPSQNNAGFDEFSVFLSR